MKDINSHSNRLSELEKKRLKRNIFASIDNQSKRKKNYRTAFSVAFTTVLIFTGLGWFYLNEEPETSITDFVTSSKNIDVNNSDKVVLILGEGENLQIDKNSSTINYSTTGQKITVGNSKQINQETSKDNRAVYNTLLVPYGERTKINLSDGSTVWLNSGTKMIYPAVFNGDRREVYLEGEAIFDVAHNKEKPFIVMSEGQEVKVLGTVFGVTSYADENTINTVLKSGSVMISFNNATSNNIDKVKITPGTKASFNKNNKSILSEKVNVDNYFSWRDGVFIFKNNDLQYIIKRVARYYNVDIVLENEELGLETFSGYLDLNENIENVMQNIKASTNMNYNYKENTIIIN
ncbi:FecR domain-containing protein [Cellulophaga baltica]|uniref:FecR family protein n=1 Tax=Cellulophaga TaxID=104264 RepID=UPI001C07680D|nr:MULTISPECIES: FecR domain-containing protein [Cellulophaga]MBU2995853.1 FecR domain-containing protein [Cellulophaga baltica]MDO6767248.1 FecR domain-containing protein [Cellulophaga sp. 1_MG-2023]